MPAFLLARQPPPDCDEGLRYGRNCVLFSSISGAYEGFVKQAVTGLTAGPTGRPYSRLTITRNAFEVCQTNIKSRIPRSMR